MNLFSIRNYPAFETIRIRNYSVFETIRYSKLLGIRNYLDDGFGTKNN